MPHPTMHFSVSSACTAYMAVPIYTYGNRNPMLGSWQSQHAAYQKNRSLNSSLRPLCGAYTDRKVTTGWPIISFTMMSLLETLCTSKKYIHLLNQFLDCWYVRAQIFFSCEHQPVLWPWGQSHKENPLSCLLLAWCDLVFCPFIHQSINICIQP